MLEPPTIIVGAYATFTVRDDLLLLATSARSEKPCNRGLSQLRLLQAPSAPADEPADVYLEDLRSAESMTWVEAENARALASIVGRGKKELSRHHSQSQSSGIYFILVLPSFKRRGSNHYQTHIDIRHCIILYPPPSKVRYHLTARS